MTPFDALEPYLMEMMLLCGFALWISVHLLISAAFLWLAKFPITLFICADAGMPTDRAMRCIMWPIKPPATASQT